jgi:nicotinic acid phosphoribosyltransferase
LVATNAARHRIMAGDSATLLEFGLRRAQGTDGGEIVQESRVTTQPSSLVTTKLA